MEKRDILFLLMLAGLISILLIILNSDLVAAAHCNETVTDSSCTCASGIKKLITDSSTEYHCVVNCTHDEDCYPDGFTPAACGDDYSCTERKCVQGYNDCEVKSTKKGCAFFYWFDNSTTECGYKEFCGTFSYYGLRTYETEQQCENVLKQKGIKVTNENATNNKGVDMSCRTLYWFDNENKSCGTREFCGAFMYLGLQTFETETACKEALTESEKPRKNCPEGSVGEDDKCYKSLSNGKKAEIKIMPETASANSIQRLGELGFNVTLKEVGKGNQTKAVYEVSGEKEGRMLGLFKVKAKVSTEIDAETGDVIKVHKPWWSFLAGI